MLGLRGGILQGKKIEKFCGQKVLEALGDGSKRLLVGFLALTLEPNYVVSTRR